MNDTFQPLMRRFVIIFFDDILVYNKNEEEHIFHLEKVLKILQTHNFLAKISKCTFGKRTMNFLGHIITGKGVEPDPSKISVMVEWPIPKTIKQLRGFLGLIGYYRRFIKRYTEVATPMTDLLKKDSFIWNKKATSSFLSLKEAMTTTPILSYPDFSKQFIVETDACMVGIGAVLLQEKHPIAYYSSKISGRMAGASIYTRKMFVITQAVCKWRHYLLGNHFIIKTDHKTLKNLLTQVIQTQDQQVFLCKLLGFHYTIEYKPGKENVMADALSKSLEAQVNSEQEGSIMALSKSFCDLIDNIKKENKTNSSTKSSIQTALKNPENAEELSISSDNLMKNGKYFVQESSDKIPLILTEFHNSTLG